MLSYTKKAEFRFFSFTEFFGKAYLSLAEEMHGTL